MRSKLLLEQVEREEQRGAMVKIIKVLCRKQIMSVKAANQNIE